MAVPAFEDLVDEVPAFDSLVDEKPAFDALVDDVPKFDDLVDEPVAPLTPEQLAQSQAAGLATLDTLTLPARFDWSQVNEKLDQQRFAEYLDLNRQADALQAQDPSQSLNPNSPANELRRKAFGIQQQMSPDTEAGRGAASIEQGARESSAQGMLAEQTPRETFRLPFSRGISGFLGPGLSSTVLPTVEAAGRQAGAAAGGALAAAKFIPHPGANLIAQIGLPILSSFMGSQVGGAVQEQITQATETPEETQQRQQRTAEAIRANPGANLMGGALAAGPFFGPSLAQFARASRGDIGALRNIGIAGTIGGGIAALQGGKPEDIAAGVFLNAFMNEPTKLGRRLGLTPSFEQQAAEAGPHRELPPLPPITGGQRLKPERPLTRAEIDARLAELRSGEVIDPKTGRPMPRILSIEEKRLMEMQAALPDEPISATQASAASQVSAEQQLLDQRNRLVIQELPKYPQGSNGRARVEAQIAELDQQIRQAQNQRQLILTGESDAQQISQASPPDGGVRPSQITPQDVPLPITGSSEGVQPGRPGEPLAQGTPTETREVIVSTAIDTPAGPIRGSKWNSPHTEMTKEAIAAGWDMKDAGRGFIVRDSDGNERFVSRKEAYEIAGKTGQRAVENTKGELNSQDLRDPDEARVSELVKAGLTEEEARAGIARAKAEDVPPAQISPETQTGTVPPPPSTGEPVARGGGEPTGATSIKNVVTAEERAARGIPPVEQVVRRGNEEVWDAAKAEVAQNPTAPDAVLAELKQKPRALTDREDFLILHRQIELQKAFDSAAAEVNRAAEAGDEPARAEALTRLNGTRDALQDIYDLGKQGGTETARGLAARRAMANADFTLAPMEMRLRAEQGGNPLTEAQAAKVKEQADTIAKTQAEMDRIRAERDALKAQQEAAKKEDAAVEPKVKSLADRIIARLDVSAANAAKSLRSRLRNLGSAPDPLIVLDVAKIAAAKTAKGAIEFAQWSADMIREFGEKVRPFLQKGWDQREQFLDAEVSRATKTRKERSAAEKEASAVKARITSLANRTAMLQERTAKGDFSPMRKPPLDLSKNPEWVKAKAANDAAKTAYEKSRYEARRAQRTTQQKVQDTVGDTLAASRTILASTDISAPGRQGIFFALPDLFFNQPRLARQLNRMFRSQFSESKFQENKARIESRDNADLYESSELYLADIDHKPSAREEQFKSELAEKIPGAGRIIRGSNRGFVAFLNTMRADAMDAFVKWSGGREKVNPETAKFLAMAVNDLTGRGNVSSRRAQGALEWLARYLFSPRLWVSRFNTAILKPIWRDPLNRAISPRARAVVLGQYIKFLGAVGALKWLAEMAGGKMELDPRDSDFGKLQFGSKRYDVMGGIGNMVTFLSRFATGKTKDDKGKLLRLAWDDEKRPERELMQVVGQHLRNKLAPIPGALYDLRYGRHPDRSKVTPTSLLQQTTVPITVSDTAGFLQRDNPAAALRDTLINALGVAVKDYHK